MLKNLSGYKNEFMFAKVRDTIIWEESAEKLLCILIDLNQSFNDHVKIACKKSVTKTMRYFKYD